jgi:hypothetical protein
MTLRGVRRDLSSTAVAELCENELSLVGVMMSRRHDCIWS